MYIPEEAWAALGVIVSAISAGGSGVAIARINKTGKKVDAASNLAEEARDLSEPTGNGYAKKTVGLLELIHAEVRDMRAEAIADRAALTGHLADHARASLSAATQRARP
jgi:hypothetical protein